jgi:surface polysaccharide O-acyltransferase-like enzyme
LPPILAEKEPVEQSSPVDHIRALAIILVIVTHAVAAFSTSYSQSPLNWWAASIYYYVSRTCVPLFIILSGALLLNPSKMNESLSTFFRKRLSRIALPLVVWGLIYFAWSRFANHQMITFNSIWQGFLGVNGQYPYYHFWFIYMLIGLYLLTPILRVLVAQADSRILGYFIALWFLGATIALLLSYFFSASLNSFIFIIPGWMGYYVLGGYLRNVRLNSRILRAMLISGFLSIVFGNWFLAAFEGTNGYINTVFTDFLSASVILLSGSLFMLLRGARTDRLKKRVPHVNQLSHKVGQYSLGIYLVHVIVLEVLGEKGLLGFNVGIINMNPILGIPLLSLCTLIVSLGVIWLLRKVPMLNKAIG